MSLCAVVFMRWLQVLEDVKGVRGVGTRILPIMEAMREVGPFTGVLLIFIMAAFFSYYAVGIKDIGDAWLIIFGLVFLGDFDMKEMAGHRDFTTISNGTITTDTIEIGADYTTLVTCLMCV